MMFKRVSQFVIPAVVAGLVLVNGASAQLVIPTSMDPETIANTGLTTIGGYIPTILTTILTVAVVVGLFGFFWRLSTKFGRGGR
jgi:hypothetical protein